MFDLCQVYLIVRVVFFPQLISQLEQDCKLNMLFSSLSNANKTSAAQISSLITYTCMGFTQNLLCVNKMKILLKEKTPKHQAYL